MITNNQTPKAIELDKSLLVQIDPSLIELNKELRNNIAKEQCSRGLFVVLTYVAIAVITTALTILI